MKTKGNEAKLWGSPPKQRKKPGRCGRNLVGSLVRTCEQSRQGTAAAKVKRRREILGGISRRSGPTQPESDAASWSASEEPGQRPPPAAKGNTPPHHVPPGRSGGAAVADERGSPHTLLGRNPQGQVSARRSHPPQSEQERPVRQMKWNHVEGARATCTVLATSPPHSPHPLQTF